MIIEYDHKIAATPFGKQGETELGRETAEEESWYVDLHLYRVFNANLGNVFMRKVSFDYVRINHW